MDAATDWTNRKDTLESRRIASEARRMVLEARRAALETRRTALEARLYSAAVAATGAPPRRSWRFVHLDQLDPPVGHAVPAVGAPSSQQNNTRQADLVVLART